MKTKRKAIKFSSLQLKNLKPEERRYQVFEDGGRGLAVRVEPSGRKSFFLSYRFGGESKTITIGRYPDIGLAQARTHAAKLYLEINKGVNPGVERKAKIQATKDAHTVKALAEEYVKHHAEPHKSESACKDDKRMLKKDILPAWGQRKAVDITRRDIVTLLDKIKERGAPVGANRTLSLLSKLFKVAVDRGILEASPCVSISRVAKEESRERVLTEQEVKDLWSGLSPDSGVSMALTMKMALRFMLVTAQRETEVLGAKWREFDMDNECWELSGDRTKNNKAHNVPLSPLALEILEEAKGLYPDSEWVFPSPNGVRRGARNAGVSALLGSSVGGAIRRTLADFKMDKWTPHDLRRTAASMIAELLSELRLDRLILKKILNHTDSEVTAIYDRHTYFDEKKQALLALSNKISGLVNPSEPAKILPMRNAGHP